MFQREAAAARARLADAIHFREKGGAWFPDTLADRNGLRLMGAATCYASPDAALAASAGRYACAFLDSEA